MRSVSKQGQHPASLPFKGQVTDQTIVKWSIGAADLLLMVFLFSLRAAGSPESSVWSLLLLRSAKPKIYNSLKRPRIELRSETTKEKTTMH